MTEEFGVSLPVGQSCVVAAVRIGSSNTQELGVDFHAFFDADTIGLILKHWRVIVDVLDLHKKSHVIPSGWCRAVFGNNR